MIECSIGSRSLRKAACRFAFCSEHDHLFEPIEYQFAIEVRADHFSSGGGAACAFDRITENGVNRSRERLCVSDVVSPSRVAIDYRFLQPAGRGGYHRHPTGKRLER